MLEIIRVVKDVISDFLLQITPLVLTIGWFDTVASRVASWESTVLRFYRRLIGRRLGARRDPTLFQRQDMKVDDQT